MYNSGMFQVLYDKLRSYVDGSLWTRVHLLFLGIIINNQIQSRSQQPFSLHEPYLLSVLH